jgi:hypothetical protein
MPTRASEFPLSTSRLSTWRGSSAGSRRRSQDVAGVILAAGIPDVKACFLETNFDAVADLPFFGVHISTVSDGYYMACSNAQIRIDNRNFTSIVVQVKIDHLHPLIFPQGAPGAEQQRRQAQQKFSSAHQAPDLLLEHRMRV